MTTLLGPARIRDLQLEGAVRMALERHAQVPCERIEVSIADGVVTLSGAVDWPHERRAALAATGTVHGVRAVNSRLHVTFG